MTNLPPHLQERIEKEATKIAQSAVGTYQGFLAGASLLYTLLKEEKGEVAGVWRKATDKEPPVIKNGNLLHIRYKGFPNLLRFLESKWYWEEGNPQQYPVHKESWSAIEWLDTETPVVAGCGELAEALELAEVELKAMYKRLGFKGSNVLDKVTESLKNV